MSEARSKIRTCGIRRRGFEVVARRVIVPSIAEIFRLIERHAGADTVVAASSISLGARVAQDKLGLPTARFIFSRSSCAA